MKSPLIIYGAGGLGRELLSFIRMMEDYQVIGFVDDGVAVGTPIKDLKVIGGLEYVNSLKSDTYLVLAFGEPAVKANKILEITSSYIRYPILIHPLAIIQDKSSVSIGQGTVICAGSILTTDIVIGEHVLINLNCTIGHDATVGKYSSLMPGVNVSGNVTIGDTVLVGAGSSIRNQISIGDRSKVGMGSVVIRNVDQDKMVAGVPARSIMNQPQSTSPA